MKSNYCHYLSISFVGNQLTLSKAFREVVHLPWKWYSLGLLLNVPKSSLSTIRTNNANDLGCLYETHQEWLKQTVPPPAWHELAEAVEPFDRSKAQKIRQRYCVGEERYEEGMNHCV